MSQAEAAKPQTAPEWPPAPRRTLWYRTVVATLRLVSAVFFPTRITGQEHLPQRGPVLVLCNHVSYLDAVLAAFSCNRPLKCLARKGLFVGPFATLIRSLGAMPVDQEGSALGGIRAGMKVLKEGHALLIFPEGGRSEDGQLQPLMPGFLPLMKRSNASVLPIAVAGAFEAWPRSRTLPRPGRLQVSVGPVLTPRDFEGMADEQRLQLVSDRLAAEFEAAVSALHKRQGR
ncbi:MAG: lysophospholipid acyltransferase family protein [Planctomycetota bacterium]